MNRAILASAPGRIQGRLKLTEQGEVVADRYANPQIALRHLEQLTNAVLVASAPEHDERVSAARQAGHAADGRAGGDRSRARTGRWSGRTPSSRTYFRAATPIEELAGLAIGSRPAAGARRARPTAVARDQLRAIPWVFAWSQSRANLPGWYGVGSAARGLRCATHGDDGLARAARRCTGTWPFFASVLDTVEMSLAKADLQVARRYAGLAPISRRDPHVWRRIRREYRPHAPTPSCRITGARPAARRDARAPALDRAAQPLRRLAVRAPGPAAGTGSARCRPPIRERAELSRLSISPSAASPPGSRTPAEGARHATPGGGSVAPSSPPSGGTIPLTAHESMPRQRTRSHPPRPRTRSHPPRPRTRSHE